MNEKVLEKKLREAIKELGGKALKFTSPYYTGMPDRIVLMPGGKIYFVEVKTTGKTLSDRQAAVAVDLQKLGFMFWIVDTQASLDNFLNEVKRNEI